MTEPLVRDPEITRILVNGKLAMRDASPPAQLGAITVTAAALERHGDDGSDPIGDLSDHAIDIHNLDPDAVQAAIVRGVNQALDERAGKGGIGQGDKGPLSENGPPAEPQEPVLMKLPDFLDGFVPPDYVVDGILKRGFLYSLTAMTGAGKTAVALLIAEIASNRTRRRKLGPHDVDHVRAIYIACENSDDVRMRLIGMEAKMDFDRADLDLLVIDKVFDLEKNLDRIRKEVDEFGGNIGIVLIDTSAAMFQGDDDNNNIQALAHAKTQRKLCELPGRPCVLSLVHPTKHVENPEKLLPRGGGAYLNEIDGNLTAWAHGDRMSRMHWAGKIRGPDFEPIEFRLPVIHTTALADSRGRLLPTVMAEVLNDAAIADSEEKTAFQNTRLLRAILDRPDGSIADWAKDCGWMSAARLGEEAKPYKSLVHRVLKRLIDRKHVKKDGDSYNLTPAGKKAAKAAPKTWNDAGTIALESEAAE